MAQRLSCSSSASGGEVNHEDEYHDDGLPDLVLATAGSKLSTADQDAEDTDDDVIKEVVAVWEEEEVPPREDDEEEESAATPVVVTLETPEAPFPLKCVTSVPLVAFTEVRKKVLVGFVFSRVYFSGVYLSHDMHAR